MRLKCHSCAPCWTCVHDCCVLLLKLLQFACHGVSTHSSVLISAVVLLLQSLLSEVIMIKTLNFHGQWPTVNRESGSEN